MLKLHTLLFIYHFASALLPIDPGTVKKMQIAEQALRPGVYLLILAVGIYPEHTAQYPQ